MVMSTYYLLRCATPKKSLERYYPSRDFWLHLLHMEFLREVNFPNKYQLIILVFLQAKSIQLSQGLVKFLVFSRVDRVSIGVTAVKR